MKRFVILSIVALSASLACADVTIGDKNYKVDTLFHRQVGPGIVNTIIRIPDYPLNVYLLHADMDNSYNRVETMQAQNTVGKTEALVNAAKRYSIGGKRVIGGVNANFWCVSNQGSASTYMLTSPYGAVVRNDTIYMNTNNVTDTWDGGPSRTGGVAIDHNKDLFLGHFTWKGTVFSPKLPAEGVQFDQVNKRCKANEMTLYNVAFSRTREFENNWINSDEKGTNNADNYFLTFKEGSSWQVNKTMTFVVSKIVNNTDRLKLGDYDACLTCTGTFKTAMAALAEGDEITIEQGWTTNEPDRDKVSPWIENMVEGNAPVMHNGELTGRNVDEPYNSQVYSRTAIGCSADQRHIYMIVIDRSTSPLYGHSAGCSTTVMCQILKSLFSDISEVVSFDAGGSAEMLQGGRIINTTTESNPRAIATAFFLESIAPEDNEITEIRFADTNLRLPMYASTVPQMLGYNQYGDIVSTEVTGFTLSIDSDIATVDGDEITAGGISGTATITATLNGMTATTNFTTMASQPAISVKPSILVDNHPWKIDVTATVDNKTYLYDASKLEWNVDDPDIAKVEDGLITGLKNGKTRISCTIGDFTDTDSVTVEISDSPYIYQSWDESWTIKGSGAKNFTLSEDGILNYTYSGTRAPYISLKKDITFYSLPDTIGLTFVSSLPIEYILMDLRNNYFTSSNYMKVGGDEGFEPNVEKTIKIDYNALGGTDNLATFPITIKEIKIVPDKTTATSGEQTLVLKAFYSHYSDVQQLEPLMGDVNGDGVIDVKDVTAIITYILGDVPQDFVIENANINGEGEIDVQDVTALINMILN
ncbi:MAG: phosphodiester glycosidase family protein [Muribaculaceae bacterium]|nr:phosphodiester glycosidase family protein [Muribaculaceae bacterium]